MKIAIYSRKSLETDKGDSIHTQIKICQNYFLRTDPSAEFEIFEDEGFTGGNTNRPSFQLMMKRVKNKDFDIIACYKVDRIARNLVDFINIYDSLEKLGVKLISVTEGFDPSTPIGKLMMVMLASFAEMERENLRQRVRDNMVELSKQGKWTGGVAPIGYKIKRVAEGTKKASYLEIDNEKVDLIKDIFKKYIETESMHKVQKWLYESNEIKWCGSTVKNILTSPLYVKANNEVVEFLSKDNEVYGEYNGINGMITYNRRPTTNNKKRWNDKSMFYAISSHEGIINPDVWLKVQYIQKKNTVAPRPNVSKLSYLTGLLKCDKCGSPMSISHNHKNADGSITYVYFCTGRKTFGKDYCNCNQVKQIIIDTHLEETLNSYIRIGYDNFEKLLCKNVIKNEYDDKIGKMKETIGKNEAKINNLVDKISMLSNIAGKPLLKKIEDITKENEDLKSELFLLENEKINSKLEDPKEKFKELKLLTTILKIGDVETKRIYLKRVVKQILFNSDTFKIKVVF